MSADECSCSIRLMRFVFTVQMCQSEMYHSTLHHSLCNTFTSCIRRGCRANITSSSSGAPFAMSSMKVPMSFRTTATGTAKGDNCGSSESSTSTISQLDSSDSEMALALLLLVSGLFDFPRLKYFKIDIFIRIHSTCGSQNDVDTSLSLLPSLATQSASLYTGSCTMRSASENDQTHIQRQRSTHNYTTTVVLVQITVPVVLHCTKN